MAIIGDSVTITNCAGVAGWLRLGAAVRWEEPPGLRTQGRAIICCDDNTVGLIVLL